MDIFRWTMVSIFITPFLFAAARIQSIQNSIFGGIIHEETENKDITIIKRIFSKYDWRVRPKGQNKTIRGGGPVVVAVNVYLRTISKIDDVNMEYNTQFTFRETWNDARLGYGQLMQWSAGDTPPFVLLVPDDPSQRIWMPDTFFQNEKSAQRHMLDKPNVLIRIYPNGDILYSVRLTLTLSCPMSLRVYPMDRQTCLIDLASYAYTSDDIMYRWKNETPIQLKDTVKSSLPSFDLIGTKTGYCTSKTATGEYSCLRVELHFQRMFSYYLLQLYIPSFMLVIVSWVSFWVDKSSVPARVTLGITTLLTITTQASGINAKLPPVSYTKAVDVWIGVCLAFVFGALLEYALVNYAGNELDRKRKKARLKDIKRCSVRGQAITGPVSIGTAIESVTPNPQTRSIFQYPELPAQTVVGVSFPHWSIEQGTSGSSPPAIPLNVIYGTQSNVSWWTRFQHWFIRLYRDADRPKKIDMISRVLFPLGFFCFNCIYWHVYYYRY